MQDSPQDCAEKSSSQRAVELRKEVPLETLRVSGFTFFSVRFRARQFVGSGERFEDRLCMKWQEFSMRFFLLRLEYFSASMTDSPWQPDASNHPEPLCRVTPNLKPCALGLQPLSASLPKPQPWRVRSTLIGVKSNRNYGYPIHSPLY